MKLATACKIPTAILAALALLTTGLTYSYLSDTETSTGNTFRAGMWWAQSTQADFESGTLNDADAVTSPGDVSLSGAYPTSGDTAAIWHMDEGSGATVHDETTNGNDGAVNGAAWTTGKYGGALEFDGTDDHISVADSASLDLTGAMTVEAWIRADTWDNPDAPYNVISVIDKGEHDTDNGYGIYSYEGKLHFRLNKDSYADAAAPLPSTGVWHHVAGVYDGSKVQLFIDGAKAEEKFYSAPIGTNDRPLYIGGAVNRLYWFSGAIDEVRISSAAKTSFPVDYFGSGTVASQVYDTGLDGAGWTELTWSEMLDAGTDITFETRASDTAFGKDDAAPAWIGVGGTSPVTAGLPSGRYKQWRATLTTADPSKTPALHDVTMYYTGGGGP